MAAKYAILVPLAESGSGDALLLEVRSQLVKQPGEVCFPGGRAESGESAAEAAVRETCEELGIEPDAIEVISELPPLIMGDGREVHPVSARLDIEGIDGLRLSEDEVAEVFLLPVSWLRENPPAHYDLASTADWELPAKLLGYLSHYGEYRKTGQTDYYEYKDHGIWGLTARIIRSLGY
ncbi:MAG: CoA pyrophosphatase [Mogibacterium sp.]|nr:CoA pyrophosphatase [Mogibacterium sp.]